MNYLQVFSMPKSQSITGRSSTIRNAFIASIVPRHNPSEKEIKEALSILKISREALRCAYCGDKSSEWDHLQPLVIDKKPTGYISEIRNLVPSCGKCNQSKGNRYWKDWMLGNAKLSPKSRRIPDIEKRIERLKKYENWGARKFDFSMSKEPWKEHFQNLDKILNMMKKSQNLAKKIKMRVANGHLSDLST